MAKVIRVNLPLDKPDATLHLCGRIKLKHTALGAGSPLTGFVNMTTFNTNLTNALNFRNDGTNSTETRTTKYEDASNMAGLGKGQTKDTKDTVYWWVQKVRNALQGKFKGSEESLSEFGFNVVVSQSGAKRNVRIKLPLNNPDDMIKLGEEIIEEDTALGAASPLAGVDTVDMTALTTLTNDSRALLTEWEDNKGDAQSFNNQAMEIIGYGAGQTSFTAGTLYFDICQVRDRLLDVYQGHEEVLSQWGFDIVIKESKKRKKNAPAPIVIEDDIDFPGVKNIDLTNINPAVNTEIIFNASGSVMRFYASDSPIGGILVTTPFFDVQPGQHIGKTIGEVILELGLGGSTPYLNVVNTGPNAGHYSVTIG